MPGSTATERDPLLSAAEEGRAGYGAAEDAPPATSEETSRFCALFEKIGKTETWQWLKDTAFGKICAEQFTCARFSKTLASSTVATLSIILYAVLNSDESKEVVASCVDSNWIVNFLGTEVTMKSIADIIQDPYLRPGEKAVKIIKFVTSGAIVGAGAAFIGLGGAGDKSDGIKFLTAISNALANFVLGGLAIDGASKPVVDFKAWWEKRYGSHEKKQKQALVSFLTKQKASMAHAPLARFSLTAGAADPRSPEAKKIQQELVKSWRQYFFGRRIQVPKSEQSKQRELLLINAAAGIPQEDKLKNGELFELLREMYAHSVAAEAPENKSRLANWSGPFLSGLGETLLFLLRYGGGTAIAVLMLSSSLGYVWTSQKAIRNEVSALDNEEAGLGLALVFQSLNLVLNVVGGYSLANNLATLSEFIVKYGRFDIVRGGWTGFITALLTAAGVVYMAKDSGVSSQNLFDNGTNPKVSQWLVWFMGLIDLMKLSKRAVVGVGATAFNAYYTLEAVLKFVKYLVLNRICAPAYIIADQKTELLDTLIKSIESLSPAQVKELCTALKDVAADNKDEDLYQDLIAELNAQGIFTPDPTDEQIRAGYEKFDYRGDCCSRFGNCI